MSLTNLLQTVETFLVNAGHKIEDVLEPNALALWNIAKGAFAQMEAVGIPQLEAITAQGLKDIASTIANGGNLTEAVAAAAANALAQLGSDAKQDINALYTYLGMQIANLQVS
jgi:hypothetical protein